jgi:NAD(P)-dependent dehydrogenase (short-subunit alcohol dehydrogenase family)
MGGRGSLTGRRHRPEFLRATAQYHKEIAMQDKPVALVTGANQGIGLQIAKDLAAHGFTVLVGSRNLERGEAASKAALNALTVAMAIELEREGIKANAVSPGFTRTNLNGYAGTETVEQGAREAVRVALLGPDGPTGTFTRWENETIPW